MHFYSTENDIYSGVRITFVAQNNVFHSSKGKLTALWLYDTVRLISGSAQSNSDGLGTKLSMVSSDIGEA